MHPCYAPPPQLVESGQASRAGPEPLSELQALVITHHYGRAPSQAAEHLMAHHESRVEHVLVVVESQSRPVLPVAQLLPLLLPWIQRSPPSRRRLDQAAGRRCRYCGHSHFRKNT
eukprot:scaffold262378_cov28-Tisochrysis_lutea.AAC.3